MLSRVLVCSALLSFTGCGKKAADVPAAAPTVVEKADASEAAEPEAAKPEAAKPEAAKPDAAAQVAPVPAPTPDEPVVLAPAAPPSAPGTDAAPPKSRPKLKKQDVAKATEAYKEFRRLLDEGRKAVKADDPATGMRKIEEALSKVPGHPSALGELGWAAYRAGEAYFDKALDATRKAISVSKKNKQKGALWYNLGRISEDQGNLELAVDSYRQSLSFRPGNEVVQKQLEGVVARLGGKDVADGLAKLEDACESVFDAWDCQTVVSAEGHKVSSCACTTEIIGPEEGVGRAALMRLTGQAEVGGSVDATYLLIEVAAKWHVVTMVGNDWNPGMGYVHNSSEKLKFQFRQIGGVGSNKRVLWVEFDNNSLDMDPGVYTEYFESTRTLTLCEVSDGRPSCWNVPLGASSEVSKLSFEEDGAIPEGEGPEKESKSMWSLSAAISANGDIEISADEGSEPTEGDAKGLPGTYTLATLGSAPGVVKLEL